MKKLLPIGFDDFKEIRQKDCYYVDKTLFIKELIDKRGKVNLFTRPRRFGKTLNLSMLRYFFEKTEREEENKDLFQGLAICKEGEKYTSLMGKYPVIFLSLKSAKQPTFEMAYHCLKETIAKEYKRYLFIMQDVQLELDKDRYMRIVMEKGLSTDYATALQFLSDCLYQYYHQKVVILIDEYDVPLENAYFGGFYKEMVDFIRSLFESALKTNISLEFGVITGCLRITKESIFTGLNNLKINSILQDGYQEYFGFLENEVEELMQFYEVEFALPTAKEWYNGYLFGTKKVYNPWSILNYVESLRENKNALPRPYWSNTSSNRVVKTLIEQAALNTKQEIEELIAGQMIEKPVYETVTYEDIYKSEDNLWNFLLFTGYLKKVEERVYGEISYINLALPNLEVKYIYRTTILEWFRENIREKNLSDFYHFMLGGEVEVFQKELSKLLMQSISYMDNTEAFYHGFLLGVLGNLKDYLVKSNREAGNGGLDIVVRSLDVSITPVIIELKVSETYQGLEKKCEEALNQIEQKRYDSWLPEEGYTEVLHYGIAFYKKQCKIKGKVKRLIE